MYLQQSLEKYKKVYWLLVLNKQLYFLQYFKNVLSADFSEYFGESIMKLKKVGA